MISVIMPLYNNEKYVIEAIKSVINQTYKNWELIIINDASTDNSENVVEKFLEEQVDPRIRFINLEENKGVSFARNLGIKESKGEYISFLDSDDLWDAKFLELSYAKIKENYKLVYTNFYYLYDTNEIKKSYSNNIDGYLNDFIIKKKNRFEFMFPFCVGCVVIEKILLEIYKIKFPEDQFLFEDVLFFSELLCVTKGGCVENTLTYYRQHKESKTHEKYTTKHYLQELIYLNRLLIFIDTAIKQNLNNRLKKVIYYRTYRIIWFVIKEGDIDKGIYLINKYRNRLERFVDTKEFKWNDRLKCKLFLLNKEVILKLLKYLK